MVGYGRRAKAGSSRWQDSVLLEAQVQVGAFVVYKHRAYASLTATGQSRGPLANSRHARRTHRCIWPAAWGNHTTSTPSCKKQAANPSSLLCREQVKHSRCKTQAVCCQVNRRLLAGMPEHQSAGMLPLSQLPLPQQLLLLPSSASSLTMIPWGSPHNCLSCQVECNAPEHNLGTA